MADLDEIAAKLDLLIALTRVGVRDPLARERRQLEEDPVSRAILASCDDWTAAGALKTAVMSATHQSEPTVKRRLGELVARGALLRRGGGRVVEYRTSGLLEL